MIASSFEESRQDSDKENDSIKTKKLIKQSYEPKWAGSVIHANEDESLFDTKYGILKLDEELFDDSDLPNFADEECRELSRKIKLLEVEREKVARESRDHKERIHKMKDHMNTVKQEISHANHLLSVKNKEITMETHLIALQDREKARIQSDVKDTTSKIRDQEDRLKHLSDNLNSTNKAIEKLKMSLNWNQEELEQWVSAAKQYENDQIDIERYTRGDDVKVKAALLKLERLMKSSIETQALLDTEVTEAQTKHNEVERLTKTFQIEHEERRKLLLNWQNTIQTMKDRDSDIDSISIKYADASRRLDGQMQDIQSKKTKISTLQTSVDSIRQEIDIDEKMIQNRRQERIDAEISFRKICDDLDQLKRDHIMSLEALKQARTKSAQAKDMISQKSRQLESLHSKYDAALNQLENEKMTVLTKEKTTQLFEDRLRKRGEQLKQEEQKIKSLERERFKQTQQLLQLQQEEKNLLSDIKNIHVSLFFSNCITEYIFLILFACYLNSPTLVFLIQKYFSLKKKRQNNKRQYIMPILNSSKLNFWYRGF
jgi:chromosome segregation ATPase